MNKKMLTAIIAVLIAIPTSSFANVKSSTLKNSTTPVPTLAILDTAIDNTIPSIKQKLIYEVCILEWNTCPNGRSFMEGANSATLPLNAITKSGFDHGTQMASLAVQANPNVKIVFVRIIGANANGLRQATGEETVYAGLDWVIRNKERFNIQAVSMSQGHHFLNAGTDYCPKTPITESKIKLLADAGVPVFLPTGNSRDYVRIDWPACIPSAIAIGATMPAGTIAIYSNHDPKLTDFFALGTVRATLPGGRLMNVAGTSASTVIAATQWATIKSAKPHLTYTEIYDLISKTSKPTYNSKITSGKLIDLQGALNG